MDLELCELLTLALTYLHAIYKRCSELDNESLFYKGESGCAVSSFKMKTKVDFILYLKSHVFDMENYIYCGLLTLNWKSSMYKPRKIILSQ